MNKMGKLSKKNKLVSSIFIGLLFLNNFIISIPKIKAPPPPPLPDQFIGEIIPNRTLSLNLLNSNVVITINSNDYPDNIGINFNANYTFFNPKNNSNIKLILPFSLGIEVVKSSFNVKLNNTQIDFGFYNFTEGTVNITDIGLDFISWFFINNSITLIQCNLAILENETYTIGYKFSGLMKNPISSGGTLFMVYYLNTSKTWNGNTTGKVEFKVYGKLPGFATMGSYDREVQVFDIVGGKSAIWEWKNLKMNMLAIGIVYDERSYSLFGIWEINTMIIVNVAFYILIITIIIIIIVRNRKEKKR